MPRGKIVVYSDAVCAGLIKSDTERKTYYFSHSDWLGKTLRPERMEKVTFETGGRSARNVKPDQ